MFLTKEELSKLGLKSYGKDVLISNKCSIYGAENISIGNNVRVDDFVILSGDITLGSNIHIAAFVALYGKYGIVMEDFTGISAHSVLFSATGDWSGRYLNMPVIPDKYTNVSHGMIKLKKFSGIGSGSVVMPGVTINEGSCIGAMSFVKKDIPEWEIWAGIPVRFIKKRSKEILNSEFLKNVQ